MAIPHNNSIFFNPVLKKSYQLTQQSREFNFKIKQTNIPVYNAPDNTCSISFFLPENTSAIYQKKILVLQPSSISYFSKGESVCLQSRLSSKGVEYSLLYVALLNIAKEYIPSFILDYLYPTDLLKCKHFALGFALGIFQSKHINTINKLINNNVLFQKLPNSKDNNLDIIAKNDFPITVFYTNILAMILNSINAEDIQKIIALLHTVKDMTYENIEKIEILLQQGLDQQTKKLTSISKELLNEIICNKILRVIILTVKPWTSSIVSEQDKTIITKRYQKIYSSSVVESTRILACYSVSINNFRDILITICQNLNNSNKININYLWLTSEHTMAFTVIKTGNGFKINFYDPGIDTARVKTILVNSIDDIAKVGMDEFIEEKYQIVNNIKINSTKSDSLHSSFFIPVDLPSDEYKQYLSTDMIELINTNNNVAINKSIINDKIIDLTQPD